MNGRDQPGWPDAQAPLGQRLPAPNDRDGAADPYRHGPHKEHACKVLTPARTCETTPKLV
jgi:hypothetical protein